MAVDLHPDIVQAISEFAQTPLGRRYDRYARKTYGMPGWKVQAKTVAGEFGGRSTRSGRGVVSSAGARGPAQFIPSTRRDFIQRYKVDPWSSDAAAVKGMALHHLSRGGIKGYNPGMPSYQDYILNQKIHPDDRRALAQGTSGSGDLTLPGRTRTDVSLQSRTIPGQSFEAERQAARRQLLLGGDITLGRLLEYKGQINDLQDIPARQAYGDLKVRRRQGPDVSVDGVAGPNAKIGGRAWGGSAFAGKRLVRAAGLPVGSRKRGTKNTASGGVSDHWDQNKDSYAWDLMTSGAQGDAVARKMARMLGVKNWSGGSWLTVNKKIGGVTFRFQLGWKVPDHHDHIHMGVDRVDIPG